MLPTIISARDCAPFYFDLATKVDVLNQSLYTVLLPASREVPRYLQNKQVVGLRIPDQPFCHALVALLGEPIITTSVALPDQAILNTAWEIEEEQGHALDLVVDCGQPLGVPSTILDLSAEEPVLLREGAGRWPI